MPSRQIVAGSGTLTDPTYVVSTIAALAKTGEKRIDRKTLLT